MSRGVEKAKTARKRRVGRPPVGAGGEKRSEMRQVTARIGDDDYALLRALAAALHTSQADVLAKALDALEETLPPDVRRVVEVLRRQPIQQK